MSNNLVFTINSVLKYQKIKEPVNVILIKEYEKIAFVFDNGQVLICYLQNQQLLRDCILQPDIFRYDIKLVKQTKILSPFNVFRQNGKWTMVGLYSDGRLRFWDLQNSKCYLVSKFCHFPDYSCMVKMGTILDSKKRFIYFIKEKKNTKSCLVIFDVWTMKSIEIEMIDFYQIVWVEIIDNKIFILDVDQKITLFDAQFLANENYLKYQKVSIHDNPLQEIMINLSKSKKTFFLPVRTRDIRFDQVLTNKDYDLKNYLSFLFIDQLCFVYSKNSFIIFQQDKFLNEQCLQNYDTYKEFIKNNQVLEFMIDIDIKKIYKKMNENQYILLIHSKDEKVYSINEQFIKNIWNDFNYTQNCNYISQIQINDQHKKLKIELPCIFDSEIKIKNLDISNQQLRIFENTFQHYHLMDDKNLQNLQQNQDKNKITSITQKINIYKLEESDTIYNQIYNIFSEQIQKVYDYQDFQRIISQKINDDDQIREEFVCNFQGNQNSYYLLAFKSGKILILPLFSACFNSHNNLEFFFLDSQVQNWDRIFVQNQQLILTDSQKLYCFDVFNRTYYKKFYSEKFVNCYKSYFKKCINKNNDSIDQFLTLYWMEISLQSQKTIPLNGSLIKIKDIQLFKKRSDEAEIIQMLNSIKVFQYSNKSIQIIILDELFFLLEHFSHEKKLISCFCDEVSNFLYLCLEDGVIEVFRFEIKSIQTILENYQTLKQNQNNKELENGIKNSIKSLFQPLKTLKLSFYNQSILKPLIQNYYNTFNDFNNINWFSQSDIIKKSKYNDIILYHLKFFFNYFNMCMNNFHKYHNNSYSFVQPVNEVFNQITEKEEKPKQNLDPFAQMIYQAEQENKKFFSKENLFNLNLQNFHLFLNNLTIDRFQFLREYFNIIPIFYHFIDDKGEIEAQLKEKNIDKSTDEIFNEIYSNFMKDSLEDIMIDKEKNEILYFQFKILEQKVSSIHYNPSMIFKEDSEWKVEFVSYFFQHVLNQNENPGENLLEFAKSFRIKMPFLKLGLSIQGLSNTITHFTSPLDSQQFMNQLLDRNDLVHNTILTTLTSFLLSYPYISQSFSKSIADELFNQFIIKRGTSVNIFTWVLYFFNDNLLLSAATHFLLNKVMQESSKYESKIKQNKIVVNKIKDIFTEQIQKLDKSEEQFSKLELALLMVLLISVDQNDWKNNSQIMDFIYKSINQAKQFKKSLKLYLKFIFCNFYFKIYYQKFTQNL